MDHKINICDVESQDIWWKCHRGVAAAREVGSVANRARLLFDVLDAVGTRIDIGRVGVKAGPAWAESGQFRSTDDTLATAEYIAHELNDYPISHWMLMGAMADLAETPLRALAGDAMFTHFRPRYHGTLMANVDVTRERGNQLVNSDTARRRLSAGGMPWMGPAQNLSFFEAGLRSIRARARPPRPRPMS